VLEARLEGIMCREKLAANNKIGRSLKGIMCWEKAGGENVLGGHLQEIICSAETCRE